MRLIPTVNYDDAPNTGVVLNHEWLTLLASILNDEEYPENFETLGDLAKFSDFINYLVESVDYDI